MESYDVSAGFYVLIYKIERICDHKMHVENEHTFPTDTRDKVGTESYVRHEVAVHNVYMEIVYPGCLYSRDLLADFSAICRKQRRCNVIFHNLSFVIRHIST